MALTVKALLKQRHLHEYRLFLAEYRRCAKELDLPHDGTPPAKSTYYHWLSDRMRQLPRGDHCQVLEHMFPGWSADELFAPDEPRRGHGRGTAAAGLLASIEPAVEPTMLSGLWCTAYVSAGFRHVDLTTVRVDSGGIAARNFPPPPRSEGRSVGFSNDIVGALCGRHLIGQWRNSSDSYYFGSLHLAVLPGETVLDGHYTAVLTDTEVETGRWRWVRIEPQTVAGIDLSSVQLAEPRQLHSMITDRSAYGPPIPLTEMVENQ